MQRSLLYLLLLGVFLVLTWAKAQKVTRCPDGEHWVEEKQSCVMIGVVTRVQDDGKCISGFIEWGSICIKPKEKPIVCPEGQIYYPKRKRCAAWLLEETTTEIV